jgi:alpha-tubulin suppressor-like RCC1 family protein
VWCWGDIGTQQNVVAPTQIAGVTHAVQVAAGNDFACALLSNGAVSCWGDNSTGEMGNGTITINPQVSPALVQW